jgi:hypothetical protein
MKKVLEVLTVIGRCVMNKEELMKFEREMGK